MELQDRLQEDIFLVAVVELNFNLLVVLAQVEQVVEQLEEMELMQQLTLVVEVVVEDVQHL
jgi:hypothetical protein